MEELDREGYGVNSVDIYLRAVLLTLSLMTGSLEVNGDKACPD